MVYDRSMMEEMFVYESHGSDKIKISPNNGYAHGKHWLDVTVSMWIEDQEKGEFSLYELRKYPGKIPTWFIDKIFGTD